VVVVWRRKDFDEKELYEISLKDMAFGNELRHRMGAPVSGADDFGHGFEMVQIAKARRAGTFRWKKLFQKVGPLFEEV